MRFNKLTKFLISIALPQLAGLIGSFSTWPQINGWYANIEKSALTPPGFVFAPVWTLLYLSMGVAFYLIWTTPIGKAKFRFAALIFFLQLALNSFWSVAFFGLESPLTALVVIASLWLLILVNLIVFYRLHKWAGLILIPYLLWVSFASYLNFMVWWLN